MRLKYPKKNLGLLSKGHFSIYGVGIKMPLLRRRRFGGGTRRVRRTMRRRGAAVGYRKRILRGGNVHKFKEIVQQASLTAGANNDTAGKINFTISNLTNWAQYKELFGNCDY